MRNHSKGEEEVNNCNNKKKYHIYTEDFNYEFLMLTSKNTHTQLSLSLLVAQLCLTLCDPMNGSPPGSSVHGIFQARIMERVAIPSSGGSSRHRDRNRASWLSFIGRQILYHWATWEAMYICIKIQIFFLSLSFTFCICVSVPPISANHCCLLYTSGFMCFFTRVPFSPKFSILCPNSKTQNDSIILWISSLKATLPGAFNLQFIEALLKNTSFLNVNWGALQSLRAVGSLKALEIHLTELQACISLVSACFVSRSRKFVPHYFQKDSYIIYSVGK